MIDTLAFSLWLMAAILFAVFVFLLIAVSCFCVMLWVIYKFIKES